MKVILTLIVILSLTGACGDASESTSQESTSQESTSQESTSQESTSQESTSQEPTPQELTQAAQAMRSMLKPLTFQRTTFAVTQPDGSPSAYVGYLFSSMGVAEWPEREGFYPEDDHQFVGPLLPDEVAIVPFQPDPSVGSLQLVIRPDDDRGVLIVEGYVEGEQDPVLRQEWTLPTVPD